MITYHVRNPRGVVVRTFGDAKSAIQWAKAHSEALAGMAAGRRLRWGQNDPTAASLQREADHCTALAEEADAEAYRLRSQAAALRRADIAQRKVA